jgi:hypothetical protein
LSGGFVLSDGEMTKVQAQMPLFPRGLRGGTRISSSKYPPDAFQCFFSRNGLYTSGPDFISAKARFGGPKLLKVTVFRWVEAFQQAIGEQGSGFAGKGEGFFSDLFDGQDHGNLLVVVNAYSACVPANWVAHSEEWGFLPTNIPLFVGGLAWC